MIKYALHCLNELCEHEFDAWFSNSEDFDVQAKAKQLICPMCQGTKIEKAIMAPVVKSPKLSKAIAERDLVKMAETVKAKISENCVDVGDKFADEARAMHYGEKPERGIYGKADPAEAKALIEEGVGVVPLPDMLSPNAKSKKKLN